MDVRLVIKHWIWPTESKGAYAPEKTQNVQVQVKGDVKDLAKYQALKERFETELFEVILGADT
jgi:hypothetical protein